MSNYTEEDLKAMTRVELRRAAIVVLGIDNKECSRTKSPELRTRILEKQANGSASGDNGKSEAAKTKSKARGKRKEEPRTQHTEAPEARGSGDVSAEHINLLLGRIDAVGKTVDESHDKLADMMTSIMEQQTELQRQQFMVFGLLNDIYRFVGEPDELEERLSDLDETWAAQGNGESGE